MNDENGVRQTYLQRAIDMTDPARAEKIIRAAGYDAVRYSAEYIRGAVSGGRPATSLGALQTNPGLFLVITKLESLVKRNLVL